MPKKIKYSNLDSCAGSMNSYGTLSISRTQIEETKEAIKEFLNKTTNEETAKEFIQKLNKKNNFGNWQNFFVGIVNKNPEIAKKFSKDVSTSTFSTIYHEMGHLQHTVNTNVNLVDLGEGKYADLFKNSIDTAKKISDYATTDPTEFVAETFSKLCTQKQIGGQLLDDDVMELYKKLGGYMLP